MKPYLLLIASIALLLSSCQSTPDEAAKGGEDLQQYTIEQFMGNTSYRGGAFSPDERTLLVTSDASGIFNAYAIPVAGGEPTALTQSDSSSVYAISYFPEDERVLFRMDDNGNEIFHLFVQGLDGQVTALMPDFALVPRRQDNQARHGAARRSGPARAEGGIRRDCGGGQRK